MLPKSWSEIYDRFGVLWGNDYDGPAWVSQAVESKWGVAEITALTRTQRALAFQKISGVLLYVEATQPFDLGFMVGLRGFVQAAFAKYFDGVCLEGPPWRLDPTEPQPVYDVWRDEAMSWF